MRFDLFSASSSNPNKFILLLLFTLATLLLLLLELAPMFGQVGGTDYWIATNRNDLTAEEIAEVYKLCWNIETFFGWWKRHLKVYHLIARSQYGLMVQLLGGLTTYLLLAIYCRQRHNEPVSISRVRGLRNQIANEAAEDQRQRTKNKIKRARSND